MLQGIDALRAEFAAQSGGDTVYFGGGSAQLGAPAQGGARGAGAVAAPASRKSSSGSKAMPIPATRAIMRWRSARGAREEVRDYLVLLGVPAAQLSATSWGKERPGRRPRRDRSWCAERLRRRGAGSR